MFGTSKPNKKADQTPKSGVELVDAPPTYPIPPDLAPYWPVRTAHLADEAHVIEKARNHKLAEYQAEQQMLDDLRRRPPEESIPHPDIDTDENGARARIRIGRYLADYELKHPSPDFTDEDYYDAIHAFRLGKAVRAKRQDDNAKAARERVRESTRCQVCNVVGAVPNAARRGQVWTVHLVSGGRLDRVCQACGDTLAATVAAGHAAQTLPDGRTRQQVVNEFLAATPALSTRPSR